MTPLVLIRHGPTDWTAERRLQGQADIPLSRAGMDVVRTWLLPSCMTNAPGDWDWLVSPLRRARQTAELLLPAAALGALRCEAALIEMHWGAWEGRRLADVREAGGPAVTAAEARGLDFSPPGGESPRQVQGRLAPLLAHLAARGRPTIAITHKGVIRAIYARAVGWDMTGRPPVRLHDDSAHAFWLQADGHPAIDRLNLPLRRLDGAP